MGSRADGYVITRALLNSEGRVFPRYRYKIACIKFM